MPKKDTLAKTLYHHLKSFNRRQKNEFISEIISDPEFLEDLRDIIIFKTRENEVGCPFEDFVLEYEKELGLKQSKS